MKSPASFNPSGCKVQDMRPGINSPWWLRLRYCWFAEGVCVGHRLEWIGLNLRVLLPTDRVGGQSRMRSGPVPARSDYGRSLVWSSDIRRPVCYSDYQPTENWYAFWKVPINRSVTCYSSVAIARPSRMHRLIHNTLYPHTHTSWPTAVIKGACTRAISRPPFFWGSHL